MFSGGQFLNFLIQIYISFWPKLGGTFAESSDPKVCQKQLESPARNAKAYFYTNSFPNTTAVNLCNNTCFCAISIKWVESCTILSAAALHAGESSKWIPLQTLKLQMHHIVHVCSQRVWECKSKNAVTLKQPPLDTVATIQLSLWWEDENKEKSDDKYKLRARLYRISCFLNTVIYLFVQFVCFLAIQIRLMAWLGFDLAGSVVYRGGRDRLLGLLASWACHKRSQVAMVVVEPD